MTRMFSFITKTWNPLGGECKHNCEYCWARRLGKRYMNRKYSGLPRLYDKEFRYHFAEKDFVFVCDMCDLFGDWVPDKLILQIIDFANESPARFLFLTKNPKRYRELLVAFESNSVLGATIETDYDRLALCDAPPRVERLREMANLDFPYKMVSIEPIMRFSPAFVLNLVGINPEFVAVGYDNYKNCLPEPALATTEALILALEAVGIKVYRKTMREKVEVLA